MPRKNNIAAKIIDNFSEYLSIALALIAIFGAAIYYLYALNWAGIILTLILSGAGLILYHRFQSAEEMKTNAAEIETNVIKTETSAAIPDKPAWWLLIFYVLIYFGLLALLWSSRSARALISPWQVVDHGFFWLYSFASLALILILVKKSIGAKIKLAALAAHYFLSFSVALIVYEIGYGFDPFIHQATMELIVAKGFVWPKPPYYLGEYSLIVVISQISGLSVYFLNKIFVPALSACLLPPAIYNFLKANLIERTTNGTKSSSGAKYLTVLFSLILTFSPFILTTPQNLSYLFLILTVLAGLRRASLISVFLLALATAAIHPLTGLPAIAWAAWLIIRKNRGRLQEKTAKIVAALIWLFSALTLPVALFWSDGRNWHNIGGGLRALSEPLQKLIASPGTAGREDWLLNLVYFLAENYNLFLILLIGAALFYFYNRKRNRQTPEAYHSLIFINSGLVIAYLLSSQIKFTSLIDYEQAAYAERIPIVIAIFFLPFILLLLNRLLAEIQNRPRTERWLWLIFGLSLLVASLYLSYPRFDKYWNSRGYSTGASDLAAVRSIAARSQSPYIVLANQQVSAAALQEFGFDHYYETTAGPLYFYPIPTGGPLYQYYLAMVYKNPVSANLDGACALAGVDEAYLIVNKYWYQSSRIINEAKLRASEWWTINNEVYIFRYAC
ncbi:MAG: hypothetical protein WC456_01915 [Patescibacteria group bacterium]